MSKGTRVRIRVDGDVVFNGAVSDWATKPPDLFKDAILPGATPQPWLKCVAVAMADALMLEQPIDIDVTTCATGYTVTVKDKGV